MVRAFGAIPSNEVKGRIRSAEKNAKMPINRGPWAKKILDLPPLRSSLIKKILYGEGEI